MTRVPVQEVPCLRDDDPIGAAARTLVDSGIPALPVVNSNGVLVGIFGERELMAAVLPGYVRELGFAGFVSGELDEALEKRAGCAREPVAQHMNTEHVSVGDDFSEIGLAETFLHHRVSVIPVERVGRPVGVVTRSEFVRRLVEALLDRA